MKHVIAVLRGGPSSEYEVSLKSGAVVIKHLPEHYEARDVFISREGEWHVGGMPMTPQRALQHADAAFIAMHGEYGEDGKVQRILETLGIPFNGSDSISSALAMNKHLTKKVYAENGLLTPRHLVINYDEDLAPHAEYIFRHFHLPVVIKPVALGSSVGVTIARGYADIVPSLKKVFERSDQALVEEFISGREATCGVINHFRGQEHYTPFPVEIVKPKASNFLDYEAKYNSADTVEICPPNFSEEVKNEIQRLAREAHKALGLRHYSRSDFIITPRGKVYMLETNTLPGLTEVSFLPKSLAAVGCSLSEFFDHVITLARSGK